MIRSLAQESASTSQATSSEIATAASVEAEGKEDADREVQVVAAKQEENDEQIAVLKRKIHSMQKENWLLKKQKKTLQSQVGFWYYISVYHDPFTIIQVQGLPGLVILIQYQYAWLKLI